MADRVEAFPHPQRDRPVVVVDGAQCFVAVERLSVGLALFGRHALGREHGFEHVALVALSGGLLDVVELLLLPSAFVRVFDLPVASAPG